MTSNKYSRGGKHRGARALVTGKGERGHSALSKENFPAEFQEISVDKRHLSQPSGETGFTVLVFLS